MRTLQIVILVGLLIWGVGTYRGYQGKPTPVKDVAEVIIKETQADPQQGLFERGKGLFKKEEGLFEKKGRHETRSFRY